MNPPLQSALSNVILRALPPASFAMLAPALEAVQLPTRFRLAEPGRECQWIYFPEAGVASVVGQIGDDWQEIGLFGNEGVGCLSSATGSRLPPYLVLMQVPGFGHRVPAKTMQEAFKADADVRDVLLSYFHAYLIQISQTSIANCQYNTVQRMARWFLMIHDRVEGDSIALTHEFIATMLGVRRTGVTLALHALEEVGLISTARKRINIVNRRGLEVMTAGVYGFAEAEYRKRFGWRSGPGREAIAAN